MESQEKESRQVTRRKKQRAKKERDQRIKAKARTVTLESGGIVAPRRLSFRQRLRNLEDLLRKQIMITSVVSQRVQTLEGILADVTIDIENKVIAGQAWEEWYEERKKAEAEREASAPEAGSESDSDQGDADPKADESEGASEPQSGAEEEGEAIKDSNQEG
jgi:hypothetical protein